MFNGAPEQFHHSLPPLQSPFSLIASATTAQNNFLPFDHPYNNLSSQSYHHHHQQLPLQTNLLHHKNEDTSEASSTVSSINVDNIERDQIQRQFPNFIDDSWSNDQVLALLRVRSTMENNCFPDLTWEHVSRKLAEIGFKKSAEKCKEKFEDESRYFNNINYCKSNRFLSELEELYQGAVDDPNPDQKKTHQLEKPMELEDNSTRDNNTQCDHKVVGKFREKKRKIRRERFEMFKGFCEGVVNQMMAQQEEVHNKLLNDMLKREEEKISREEEWKKQEVDRMNKEHEMMAQELELARDKHATIVEFLKKHVATTSPPSNQNKYLKSRTKASRRRSSQNPNPSTFLVCDSNVPTGSGNCTSGGNNLAPAPSSSMIILDNHHQTIAPTSPIQNNSNLLNPSSSTTLLQVIPSSNSFPPTNNPSCNSSPLECLNSVSKHKATSTTLVPYTEKEDIVGRRWPRDEVLALINLRCMSLNSNNNNNKNRNDDEEKDQGNIKGPLWERISQGMSEMGYKRSAKRCKEKWENINKYFRKTKDNVSSKKRSLDSRTCPYFHQLSCLYNNNQQGKIAPQSQKPLE